jgi:hypothetical protein
MFFSLFYGRAGRPYTAASHPLRIPVARFGATIAGCRQLPSGGLCRIFIFNKTKLSAF